MVLDHRPRAWYDDCMTTATASMTNLTDDHLDLIAELACAEVERMRLRMEGESDVLEIEAIRDDMTNILDLLMTLRGDMQDFRDWALA